MPARILRTTWHEQGPAACVRKLSAATRMTLPVMLRGRRTLGGVAAYFDLITDEGRRFYGDSFHFGYFRTGSETLPQALDAHTDLVAEMARPAGEEHILDAGRRVGFSDLALHTRPPPTDNHTLRALLYHRGEELVTDWPALFLRHGFSVIDCQDIITETMPTWHHTQTIYDDRRSEVVHRYGRRIADRMRAQVHRIPTILARYATFPVLSVLK